MSGQVIWCLGLYASASTWLYNIAREAAEISHPGQVRTYFFSGETASSVYDRPGYTNIVKSHEISSESTIAELGRRSDKIIVSVRDPRDAATSLMLYHGHEFERALPLVEAAMRLCVQFAKDGRALLFQYETGFFDKPETIKRVTNHLGFQLSEETQQTLFAATRRPAIESFIANLPRMPGTLQDRISGDRLDPRTHWHTHHAGRSGEIGRWRHMLTPSQAEDIKRRLADCVQLDG